MSIDHDADGAIVVALTSPIEVRGALVGKLSFRPPNLGALIAAEDAGRNGQHRTTAMLMAAMARVELKEIEQLSIVDYQRCFAALDEFLDTNLRPGGPQS